MELWAPLKIRKLLLPPGIGIYTTRNALLSLPSPTRGRGDLCRYLCPDGEGQGEGIEQQCLFTSLIPDVGSIFDGLQHTDITDYNG